MMSYSSWPQYWICSSGNYTVMAELLIMKWVKWVSWICKNNITVFVLVVHVFTAIHLLVLSAIYDEGMTGKLGGNMNYSLLVKSKVLHNLHQFLDLNLVVVCQLFSFAGKVWIVFFFFGERRCGLLSPWCRTCHTLCMSFLFLCFF